MTQSSRLNADHIASYPTSDAGPYSRDQWAELFHIIFTGDQRTTQGPFTRYLNELEVTNPAGVTIRVATGAGICTGTTLINSAVVDFTPTTPGVGDRIDKVVMCLNNTNTTYNTNLEFPTDLTDYNGTASIEPYSCRLVILTGVDGGAARALVQTGSYYMVELARYTITMAPNISVGPTDYREFCLFASTVRTRRFLVQCAGGWNSTDLAELSYDNKWGRGFALLDGKTCNAAGACAVPTDYASDFSVRAVISSYASGNAYLYAYMYLNECDEAVDATWITSAVSAVAITLNTNECVKELTGTPSTDDFAKIVLQRQGADALDTVNDVVYIWGWVVTYTAKS